MGTSPTTDPFHNNNNNNKFSSGGNDPFSLTNLRPPPAVPETSSKSTDRVASTTSTLSYRKEKVSSESADPSTSKASLKKKTSHSLSDFLTGSPLKGADKDKEKVKEKKKHGKFHISSPLKAHKSKNGESPKSSSKSSAPSDNGVDEVQMKMAAEVSRRSEDERRRKLQPQEEADLAYAIALSKAEAASLKSQ